MITCVATLKDMLLLEEIGESASLKSLLYCFSLKRNVKTLFNLSRTADDVQSIHGIRMINALMLILCHKSMALFFMPYSNRYDKKET